MNASTLDGWWAEAWETFGRQGVPIGWAIGRGEEYADLAYQDQIESEALYEVLERDIVPTFYDRGAEGVPTSWVTMVRHTLATLRPQVQACRMVQEYVERLYAPAAESAAAMRLAR